MGVHNSMERFLATLDSFLANNGARLQVRARAGAAAGGGTDRGRKAGRRAGRQRACVCVGG